MLFIFMNLSAPFKKGSARGHFLFVSLFGLFFGIRVQAQPNEEYWDTNKNDQ